MAAVRRNCPYCAEEVAPEAEVCLVCGTLLGEPTQCALHPERSTQAQCVVCGQPVCKECDRAEGRTHLCPQHAGVPVVEGWAQVYTTSDDIAAGLIRENLIAEGIEAQVLSQKDHFSFTVGLGDLSPVRLLVPAYRYEDACDHVRAHMDDHGEVRFGCPSCGAVYDAGETICSACGARLA
jgi:hypothetical protein